LLFFTTEAQRGRRGEGGREVDWGWVRKFGNKRLTDALQLVRDTWC
jgi:hypothetical protein